MTKRKGVKEVFIVTIRTGESEKDNNKDLKYHYCNIIGIYRTVPMNY